MAILLNNPSSKQVLNVIQNLEKALSMVTREKHLDMCIGQVNNFFGEICPTICGTVHCHGGWYAIVVFDTKEIPVDYTHGANQMAHDLGFAFYGHLMAWANSNPKIWGNENGAAMFSNSIAFEGEGRWNGARNLQDIINHWKEVYERLKAMESPVYEDITTTLAVLPEVGDKVDVKVKELV